MYSKMLVVFLSIRTLGYYPQRFVCDENSLPEFVVNSSSLKCFNLNLKLALPECAF